MLKELLKNPAATEGDLHLALNRLQETEQQPLHVLLNRGDETERPINLAVRYAAPEVVALLLNHDCQITGETNKFLSERTYDIPEVMALLDFYEFLQTQARGLQEFFPLGKTLKLVNETMVHLNPFLRAPVSGRKPAIVCIGETKVGKSSLCNALYGAEYDLAIVKRRRTLVLRDPSQSVKVKVSDLFRSETSYPQILAEPKDH